MDNRLTIHSTITIKEAMKQLDLTAEKVLLIVDDSCRLMGALSDGDVRRALLSGKMLSESIEGVFNPTPVYIFEDALTDEIVRSLMLEQKIELIPVVSRDMLIVDCITWDSVFSKTKNELFYTGEQIGLPVVIMAGGKGLRMEPFTKVLPKPLIPIGEKTIAELIIEQFAVFGVKDYYFTLNYRGDMIKAYFNSINHPYNITYVNEDDFYGTAGSLKLLDQKIRGPFIVSNCDILVRANYADVLAFHRKNNSELTVLSAVQHHQIPYGVIKFGKDGAISEIQEKPEHTFTINTGVYVINSECLDIIPPGTIFHMTDLIQKLMDMKRCVFTYPVNSNDYIDIGQWDEYRKTVGKIMV